MFFRSLLYYDKIILYIISAYHEYIISAYHEYIISAYHEYIISAYHEYIISAYHEYIISAYHEYIISAYHEYIVHYITTKKWIGFADQLKTNIILYNINILIPAYNIIPGVCMSTAMTCDARACSSSNDVASLPIGHGHTDL